MSFMTKIVMKLQRYFLFLPFFWINICTAQSSLQAKADAFAQFSGFSNASISLLAVDCANGSVIMDYDSQRALPSASTMKLFATASALELVGSNYKPKTILYYEGSISTDSTLNGNIWISGRGDMTLGSSYFYSDAERSVFLDDWVRAIRKAGINRINGSVIGDGSAFGYEGAPDGWSWSDLGNYYGAGFSGLMVYDNILYYHFKTGSIGQTAQLNYTFPTVAHLLFHNYIKASGVSGDNSYIYGAPYSLDRFGTGELPANKADFVVKGSLPDPEYQVADELTHALTGRGIIVAGSPVSVRKSELTLPATSSLQPILEYEGKSLFEIAKQTNYKSINVFAEGLLCTIGYVKTGNGSTASSTRFVENHWAKQFNTSGFQMKDGSGLSRSNSVSAAHFCSLLKAMKSSSNFADFYATLPVSGESGTLKNVCKNQSAHGRVHAKSGTMNRIKSYAGYIESSSGKTIAFAVIVTNYNSSNAATVDEMEKLFNALSTY